MDSADPYSDGILKMPIVIDNVRQKPIFLILCTHNLGIKSLNNSNIIGFRSDQGRFQW